MLFLPQYQKAPDFSRGMNGVFLGLRYGVSPPRLHKKPQTLVCGGSLMTNLEIAKLLRNVAASYTIKDENKFRFQIIAYQKAADAIRNSSSEIMDLFKEKKLSSLPGIGPSISSHLEELLKTGNVKRFDWVTSGIPKSVFTLLDIPTIGPKRAYKLTYELSLKNPETVVDDLKKAGKMGKIAKIEGFGEKSQDDILRAISDIY